jgi:hypothetical protein
MNENLDRVRRLLRRRGWTLHIKLYSRNRLYIAAAKRGPDGTWHGAYIASVKRLSLMTDEAIMLKIPDVA